MMRGRGIKGNTCGLRGAGRRWRRQEGAAEDQTETWRAGGEEWQVKGAGVEDVGCGVDDDGGGCGKERKKTIHRQKMIATCAGGGRLWRGDAGGGGRKTGQQARSDLESMKGRGRGEKGRQMQVARARAAVAKAGSHCSKPRRDPWVAVWGK